MSEYKGIKGYSIQSINQEPTKGFPGEIANTGQVWFAPDDNFYLQKNIAVGSWTSANLMNTARTSLTGTGTQTAALAFGGTPLLATTEKYDGTNWTSVNSMNTGRALLAGAGTQTSALAFGPPTGATEKYDGTNWTTVTSLNTSRTSLAGAGTQTAALAFGGTSPVSAATERYDGTNWTTVNSMNSSKTLLAGAGTQTAALAFGGQTGPGTPLSLTEEWNDSYSKKITIT